MMQTHSDGSNGFSLSGMPLTSMSREMRIIAVALVAGMLLSAVGFTPVGGVFFFVAFASALVLVAKEVDRRIHK